jgi:5-methylcytosine-specific restriction endonuclease McrA
MAGKFTIKEMEGDHILEHSQYGTTTIDNLQMLCKGCHKNKTSKFLLKTF